MHSLGAIETQLNACSCQMENKAGLRRLDELDLVRLKQLVHVVFTEGSKGKDAENDRKQTLDCPVAIKH